MKRMLSALLLAMLTSLFANDAHAQAKWAKNAIKSTFTLKTFSADGNLIGSCGGFYVNTEGEAVANFAPFKGASRAVVIDANGVEQQVEHIIGANDIYDLAKFKVNASKTQPAKIATAALQKDNIAWLLPYTVKKTPETIMGTVTRVEQPTDKYSYYTMQMQVPETAGGSPVFNDNGEVVGIMQQPVNGDKDAYATDVHMATDLAAKPLIINDPILSQTMLKKALPEDIKDAIVTLLTAQTIADLPTLSSIIEDFIKKFPNSPEGYKNRAQSFVKAGNYADADRDMQHAIKIGTELDDTYYTYARMIYSHQLYEQPEKQYAPWTLDLAEDAINKAYAQNPQPVFLEMKAQIKFSHNQYAEAYNVYKQLIDNGNATAENYYGAARCKEQLGDSITMLALLDSAVATFSKPYIRDAAPYFLARAEARISQGKMREAIQDLNVYEKLIPQVNDRFYYIRFEAESKCRLFQQALNDIRQAISKNDSNTFYYSEKASLEIRVKLYKDAIDTAQQLITLEPENSDGYLFLGLAQCLNGDKATGTKNLKKAKQLGDAQAQSLIERYGK